jgi:hypothetical protein
MAERKVKIPPELEQVAERLLSKWGRKLLRWLKRRVGK